MSTPLESALIEVVRAAVVDALATQPDQPKVLTLEGAARYLGTSSRQVKALVDTGDLPCLRVGREHRIGVAALDELLARGAAVSA